MAILRERPYTNFNFLVDLGDGAEGVHAGFQEVRLPELWLDVVQYRNGNDRENAPRKLTGLEHCGNLVLRRGIIGSLDLYAWYNQVRNGDQQALRTVTVHLQSEDRSAVVLSWKMLRARPVKIRFGDLNAKGSDVAIEELELACERVELE